MNQNKSKIQRQMRHLASFKSFLLLFVVVVVVNSGKIAVVYINIDLKFFEVLSNFEKR